MKNIFDLDLDLMYIVVDTLKKVIEEDFDDIIFYETKTDFYTVLDIKSILYN